MFVYIDSIKTDLYFVSVLHNILLTDPLSVWITGSRSDLNVVVLWICGLPNRIVQYIFIYSSRIVGLVNEIKTTYKFVFSHKCCLVQMVCKQNKWMVHKSVSLTPIKKTLYYTKTSKKSSHLGYPRSKRKTTWVNNHSIIYHSFILNKTLSIYCKSSKNYRLHKSYRSLYSAIIVNHSANFGSSRSITFFHPMEDTNSYDVCLLLNELI